MHKTLTTQTHADLLFILFSSGEQQLYTMYKNIDYKNIEQQSTDFYYTHIDTIDNLKALQQIKRSTLNFDLTFFYRTQKHWYDSNTGKILRTWYDVAHKAEATHMEVVLRKKQLDKQTRTEYKRLVKMHYEQYLLYKHKLATRTR